MLVYRATNTVNGKVYIGKWARDTVKLRWQLHVSDAKHGSPYYFHRAIRKYGPDAFTVEVIYRAKTYDELSKMETFFIVLHQSYVPQNGYNMTRGGEGQMGWKHTLEAKAKMWVPVRCIETGEMFPSMTSVASKFGGCSQNLSRAIKCGYQFAGRRWEYAR